MKEDANILRENNPNVLLTVKEKFKSSPIPLNLNDSDEVEVGGVLNLKGEELKRIPTSTTIPKIDLKYDKNYSSILEVGFDTEYVTNTSCMKKLKESINTDSLEFRSFLKEKDLLLLDVDDEGKEKQREEFVNSKGLNYLISYQYYVHYYSLDRNGDVTQPKKWGNVYLVNQKEINWENFKNQFRLSLDEFLRLVLSDGIKRNKITHLPSKIKMYCHYSKADITYFRDFWDDDSSKELRNKMDNLRGTFTTLKKPINLECDNYKCDFSVYDTLHLSPSKNRKLSEVSKLVDKNEKLRKEFGLTEKLTKKPMSKSEIQNMDEVRDNNLTRFWEYGLTDAKICVYYVESLRLLLRDIGLSRNDPTTFVNEKKKDELVLDDRNFGYFWIPNTLTAIGVKYLMRIWENFYEDDEISNELELIRINNSEYPAPNDKKKLSQFNYSYFRGKVLGVIFSQTPVWKDGKVISTDVKWVKTPNEKNIPNYHQFEGLIENSYYGGRNEQFCYGPSLPYNETKKLFYDYDLVSAYPSAMVNLGVINWSSYESTGKKDLLHKKDRDYFKDTFGIDFDSNNPAGDWVGFFHVKFSFKDDVKFPTIPVRSKDESSILFPKEGESFITGWELRISYELGMNECLIKNGVLFETDKSFKPFKNFTQRCVERRRECENNKDEFGKNFWKEISNSLYGKTAQGITGRKVRNLRKEFLDNEYLPESDLTNPAIASLTTSMVRSMLGYLLNKLPQIEECIIWNVTTDGFQTNFPHQHKLWNKTKNHWLMKYWINNRETIEEGLSKKKFKITNVLSFKNSKTNEFKKTVIEMKHCGGQIIGWRTRGQSTIPDLLGLNKDNDDVRFLSENEEKFENSYSTGEGYELEADQVTDEILENFTDQYALAKGNTKLEDEFPNEGLLQMNYYFLNRTYNMKSEVSFIASLYEMYSEKTEGGDPVDLKLRKRISMDFDWKRRPISGGLKCEDREVKVFDVGVVNEMEKENGSEKYVKFKSILDVDKYNQYQYEKDKNEKIIYKEDGSPTYKKHLHFETKPVKNKEEYHLLKYGWKLFRDKMWDVGRGENSVLKTKSTLSEFLLWNKESKDRLENKPTYRRKSLKKGDFEGSEDPFFLHFKDCIINNKKGIVIDLNKSGFKMGDFIFKITVLYEMGSSSDVQIRNYSIRNRMGSNKLKNKLSRKFSVRKNKWKNELIDKRFLEKEPYDYYKKYFNFLSVLKEGRDKNTNKYVEYFKDLEIVKFVGLITTEIE
jgi:hypothetical protein